MIIILTASIHNGRLEKKQSPAQKQIKILMAFGNISYITSQTENTANMIVTKNNIPWFRLVKRDLICDLILKINSFI